VYALLVNNVVAAVHVLMSPLTLGGKRFAREGARGLIAGGSVASLQVVADQIGAVEAAQVDALMHGQSSAMEALIGGARRRSHMRRQGRRCRTPKGRRPER